MITVTHIIPLIEKKRCFPLSGAENHLMVLMEAQVKKGYNVEFVPLVISKGPFIENVFLHLEEKNIKVRPFFIRLSYLNFLNDILIILRLRKHLRYSRRDIIHTHLDVGDFYGQVAGRISGCKTIVSTNHNNEPHYNLITWKIRIRLLDFFVSKYIAISLSVKNHLIKTAGTRPEKITVVHYGIPMINRPSNREIDVIKEHFGIAKNLFIVGFVGRLVTQKNLPVLVRAVSKLKNVQCIIAGTGGSEKALKGLVLKSGISNVKFLGHVLDAYKLMPAFNILCLPSKWEGFGMVLLEAMFQKIPIVGSKSGAITEILGQGDYGFLFEPDDVSGLRKIIVEASENPESLKSVADKAFNYALLNFGPEKMTDETEAVYKTVVKL